MADAFGKTTEEMLDSVEEYPEVASINADDEEVIRSGKPKTIPEEYFTNIYGVGKWYRSLKIPYRTVEEDKQVMSRGRVCGGTRVN